MNEASIKIVFESKLTYLPLLRKATYGICSYIIQNEQFLYDMGLCLHEAVSNVINHSYHCEPGHEIQVVVNLQPKQLEFQIIDDGLKTSQVNLEPKIQAEFDPKDINTVPEAGRGLFIIHQLMDKVTYTSHEGKNILSLCKYLNKS